MNFHLSTYPIGYLLIILCLLTGCSEQAGTLTEDAGTSNMATADTSNDVDSAQDAGDANSTDIPDAREEELTDTSDTDVDTREWAGPEDFEKPPPDPTTSPRSFASANDFSLPDDVISAGLTSPDYSSQSLFLNEKSG